MGGLAESGWLSGRYNVSASHNLRAHTLTLAYESRRTYGALIIILNYTYVCMRAHADITVLACDVYIQGFRRVYMYVCLYI